MTAWGDDPELLATFRAEVEERLGSLQAGLLALEAHGAPRQVVAGLFRDAHTVKGSARMLGLGGVLRVSHAMEDLLGALRDERLTVRSDLVDLLLSSCDVIGRALPGGELDEQALEPVLAALAAATGGQCPVAVPVLAAAAPAAPAPVSAPVSTMAQPPSPREPVRALVPAQIVVREAVASEVVRAGSDSVRVAASKVYELLDVVGEADLGARRIEQTAGQLLRLAAEQARWSQTLRQAGLRSATTLPPDVALALHRLVGAGTELSTAVGGLRELVEDHRGGMAQVRDGAMGLAMVPVRRAFAPLARIVRDVAQRTGKAVRLETAGEDVEIDKQVLDGVAEALKHLVVNAVDHGCEPAPVRLAAGKPAESVVRVTARGVAGTVVLEVADDGAGVDDDRVRSQAVRHGLLPPDSTLTGPPLQELLFTPAFSTAPQVTETSGRGVGLDVVRDAVEGLGGTVEVRSERGTGTAFVLTLPVTLGVLRCLLARVGDERYAIPVSGVVESLSLRSGSGAPAVHVLGGATVVVRHGASIPLLDLGAVLGLRRAPGDLPKAALVVRHTGGAGSQLAWSVDRLEGESELVVKDLDGFLGRVPGIAGATIAADGSVVCLLDLRELAERMLGGAPVLPGVSSQQISPPTPVPARRARVLVVEDSVGVRELQRVILEGAGYQVETAVDGLDGAARLRDEPADLVLSDVEMPGMDGFDLTRTIRRTKGWENVPVIIMTSRGEAYARQAGLEAGCSAYLLKTEFDQDQLVQTVRRLVGR
ncbi:MAG: response regulator [Actinobacteria bacterium]|nr:response regulator [Actinomycetota bacterium]